MKTMNETTQRQQGGFTLIEMLLVILFLGILAGIALFGADAFGARARDTCSSNNARIEETAESLIGLGGTGSLYTVEPGDCEALGGLDIWVPEAFDPRPLSVGAGDGESL